MASENAGFETTSTDTEDVKKKAITRLTVAGLVTATALAGLWWLDQGNAPSKDKSAATPRPVPIRPAGAPDTPLPQLDIEEPLAEEISPQDPAQTTPSNAGTSPAEPPPPPRIHNAGPISAKPTIAAAPSPAAHTLSKPGPQTSAPLSTPSSSPAKTSAPAAPPPITPLPTAPGASFVVQLGVFRDYARAEELVMRLKNQGIKASTETRVQLGPFLNRQEAEKAQTEIKRLGLSAVVTTGVPTK